MCQPGRCFPAGMGHGVPKGSLGKMPGIRGSCEELQGHPWQSQEHPALCTAVDRAASSPVCCGLAGVPQELHSFWVSFEGLCRAGGRVTVWAAFLPAVSPGGQRQEQGHSPQPALPCLKHLNESLCLPANQCLYQGPSCALTEPQCARTRRSWGTLDPWLWGLAEQSLAGAACSALGRMETHVPLASGVWVP